MKQRHWLCPEYSLFSDVISMYFVEIKKAWEYFLRAYPSSQAFALPLRKDKQRKPAHAKETICPTPILHTHEKMGVQLVQGYNPLTQTLSVALPLCEEIKVAKFDYTDSNVRKRLKASPHVTWLYSRICVEPTQPCGLTAFLFVMSSHRE